ncbi:hypothetical protein RYH80_18370 [Halobaculum sp. MBLA0147]|uniref:GP88 family protein n=1 Tax=Halobaculum sp. MBLA0147 TaxID=3079934 RepID=UPI003526A0DD
MSEATPNQAQAPLTSYKGNRTPTTGNTFESPDDDELEHVIAPDWMYPYDVNDIEGIHELRRRIRDAEEALNGLKAWTELIKDHITFGNSGKVGKTVGIYNLNTAHDCVNRGTDYCQVGPDECYAVRAEHRQVHPIHYRRRQEIIWDHIDASTFATAFKRIVRRKRNRVDALRIPQSGDFRHQHDLLKAEEIARILQPQYKVYTYTASTWLDLSEADALTVNASNEHAAGADRRFIVVEDTEDIPQNGIQCPKDLTDDIWCGQCQLCLDSDAGDIYTKKI